MGEHRPASDSANVLGGLVEAAAAGEWWDPDPRRPLLLAEKPSVSDWDPAATVDAVALVQLLTTGRVDSVPTSPPGPLRAVRLRRVRVVGELNLEHAKLECSLELQGCWLDYDAAPVSLKEATCPLIKIIGCWFSAGLNCDQITVTSGLWLNRCTMLGRTRLIGARIGGDLDLIGTTFDHANGSAIDADQAFVRGTVRCDEVTAIGTVSLTGIEVGGDLVLRGGHFFQIRAGDALTVDQAQVAGSAFFDGGFQAIGPVRMVGAKIGW